MPVSTVFENLEAGLTVEKVMEEFAVTRERSNAAAPAKPGVLSCEGIFKEKPCEATE